MRYYIGIDWSRKKYNVCIINEKGVKNYEFEFIKNKNGFNNLFKIIRKLNTPKKDLIFGIETHKDILAEYLLVNKYILFSLNPASVNKFQAIYSIAKQKDDKFDAYNIACMLKISEQRLIPVCNEDSNSSGLLIHCKTRRKLIKDRSKLITRLKDLLSLYLPVYIDFFNNFSTSVPLNLLLLLNKPNDFNKLSLQEYLLLVKEVKFMPEKRKIFFYKFVQEKIINFESTKADAYAFNVKTLVEQIIFINQQIKKIQCKIAEIMDENKFKKVFYSLPGASSILTAELASQFGENKGKFESYQSVQSYAGTSPVTRSSGESLNKTKMRMSCNKTFRNTLYQFAFCSINLESWAREYYDKQRVKGKVHTVAIRALSNKWTKIIYRMWKDEILYNSEIFLSKRKEYLKN